MIPTTAPPAYGGGRPLLAHPVVDEPRADFDSTRAAVREAGADAGLGITWTSPPIHHCSFSALLESRPDHDGFVTRLMSMSEDDPQIREPMRLEYVHRWVPPDVSGYVDLLEAVRQATDGGVVGRSAVMSGPP